MKRYLLLLTAALTILTGCETTTEQAISENTVVTYLRMMSYFDSSVKSYTFTIDTVNNLIYNEDSLPFGTRVDSLAPMMTPLFNTCMIDDSINLYGHDTVYVNFTKEHVLTVTSSNDEKSRSYKIWVNVHTVNPDTIEWNYMGALHDDDVINDRCVSTEDGDMYWLLNKGGELMVLSAKNAKQWDYFTTEGITKKVDEIDIDHAITHNGEVCMMSGMTLFTSNKGVNWTSKETTSEIEIEHLMFSLYGSLYALGKGNKIMRLNGTNWEETAQMPSGFPVRGESVCTAKSPSGSWRVIVACGIDEMGNYISDVWSSENGSYWVQLNLKDSLIDGRAYAGMVQYASGLIMLGGTDKDGEMVEDNCLFSKDYGMTWQELGDEFSIDSTVSYLFARREKHSIALTADGYIIVTGGTYYFPTIKGIPPREKKKKINDMWKGMHFASLPGFKR